MKAIRVHQFGDPTVMTLETVPDPAPGPGEVVVSVAAAGVNPVDTYIRSGTYAVRPELPYTPGMDAAGRILSVGDGVTRLGVGDRVYVAGAKSGTYAEECLCAVSNAHPLPETVSEIQGAGVGVPYGAAYTALFHRAEARPGETVLVHGATGGVGTAAVQLARAAGMTVIATGSTPEGRKMIAAEGAHHVLNHSADGYLAGIADLTDGRGPDVILEMLANVNLGADLQTVAAGGRIVVIGSLGTVEINPRDAMSRGAAILGMILMNATEVQKAQTHAALGAGLENGALRPVITVQLPLAEAPSAHERVMAPGARGQIVLVT